MKESIKPTPEWEKELEIFDAFLQERLGFGVADIIDEKKVREALPANYMPSYAPQVIVEYANRSAKLGQKKDFMHESLPMEHTFDADDVPGDRTWRAHLRIDPRLSDSLVRSPGDQDKPEKMRRHISNLAHIASHDFTAHAMGIDINSFEIDTVVEKLDFGQSPFEIPPAERLAVMTHRILFDEACELSPVLRRFALSEVKKALAMTEPLEGKEKQDWLTVIKYEMYSLFDPESEDVKELRAMYQNPPFKGLEPGYWAECVHQKNFKLKNSNMRISDKALFDIIFGYKHSKAGNIFQKAKIARRIDAEAA